MESYLDTQMDSSWQSHLQLTGPQTALFRLSSDIEEPSQPEIELPHIHLDRDTHDSNSTGERGSGPREESSSTSTECVSLSIDTNERHSQQAGNDHADRCPTSSHRNGDTSSADTRNPGPSFSSSPHALVRLHTHAKTTEHTSVSCGCSLCGFIILSVILGLAFHWLPSNPLMIVWAVLTGLCLVLFLLSLGVGASYWSRIQARTGSWIKLNRHTLYKLYCIHCTVLVVYSVAICIFMIVVVIVVRSSINNQAGRDD